MKVEFSNTFLDILRFHASHQFRNIPFQLIYVLLALALGYITYTSEVGEVSLTEAIIVGVNAYLFLWFIQLIFNVVYLYSRKNKSVFTTHLVEIQDESFYEETPYNRSYFYWHGIVKVINIFGFIAVYVTPYSAVIIPNRAFENPQKREEFFNQLKSKFEYSQT